MRTTLVLLLSLLATATAEERTPPAAEPVPPIVQDAVERERPRIDVVFVLDTTGSMRSLIAGAKRKVWAVANAIATADRTPEIRMGLVAYRDRGDEYITLQTPLTADLDAVYSNLMKFEAGGGGDGPESVNQALHEAVTQMEWSEDARALRLVYLVGDAPPHMDYEQDVHYPETCKRAASSGIIINTIQCGSLNGTQEVWQEIARKAEGEYFAIDQSGGMTAVATPFDAELATLASDLDGTLLAYGRADEQRALHSKLRMSREIDEEAPTDALADRAAYKAGLAGGASLGGDKELVSDFADGRARLEELSDEELPPELRGKDLEEQRSVIAEKQAERKVIQERIQELSKKREAFVQEKLSGQKDAFDQKVLEALRRQAAEKGIHYPEK